MLSQVERDYLAGLQESPVWLSILEKLRTVTPPPMYAPRKDGQYERWIYLSGGHDAIKGMLQILHGRAIILELEGDHD